MLISKFKKILIVFLAIMIILTSFLYFLVEAGIILNNKTTHTVKEVNLNYMNKAIDGYNGEIDEQEFMERFISWSFLNLYSENQKINDVEFDFAFEGQEVYAQILIDENIYVVFEFFEHQN